MWEGGSREAPPYPDLEYLAQARQVFRVNPAGATLNESNPRLTPPHSSGDIVLCPATGHPGGADLGLGWGHGSWASMFQGGSPFFKRGKRCVHVAWWRDGKAGLPEPFPMARRSLKSLTSSPVRLELWGIGARIEL